MKIGKLFLAGVLASGMLFAGTFNLDKTHSNVSFKVKHMMISTVDGSFDTFDGSFAYDVDTKMLQSLSGTVDVNSVNTKVVKRDDHLRSADFFDVEMYPTMTFTLDKVEGERAHGTLSIHGVTKKVIFDLEQNGPITDPWGNIRMGITLSGDLNRDEYGLTWNKAMEAGGVLVSNKIKINIELEGILAK